MKKTQILILIAASIVLTVACEHDKTNLPTIPPGEEQFTSLDDAEYVQLNPVLDASLGSEYDFIRPADVYVGVDNFIYVANTGKNEIVMMDGGGQIQGRSQFISQPEAITQNDSLQLLIVNKTNAIYRIDLFEYNHNIGAAPVDTVFKQASEPTRQFTGITVHDGFEYYVTVVDVADSSTNFREFSFIYDFTANHTLKGPLPMNVNGTGLFSAIVPTGIVSLREGFPAFPFSENTPAFFFSQTGRTSLLNNNFKVQLVSTDVVEGDIILAPGIRFIGNDIYDPNRFYNPEDVTIDRAGFVFVVEAGSPGGTIQAPGFYRFSFTSGNQLQSVTGFGDGEMEFNNPKGIAVLPEDEQQIVYVADTGNNRIMMFQLNTEL